MSSEEVYETIWNRYNEAFDGNMTSITACISGPIEWEAVNNRFVHEIRQRVCIPELNAYKAAREANTRLQYAFNPNYLRHDSQAVVIFDMTSDQWRRIANQPMDAARFAAFMKEQLASAP